MAARQYANSAPPTTLATAASAGDTTITLATTAGLPAAFPFFLSIDPDGVNLEIVLVTNLVGPVATVTRGQDNTTAVSHNAGVTVQHCHVAKDFQDAQNHVDTVTGVHGVGGGAVVGTTLSQNLSNKTLIAASAATVAEVVQGFTGQTADLTQWKDATSNILARLSKDGALAARQALLAAQGAAETPLVAQGFTAQSANLVELRDHDGAVLARFDRAGNLSAPAARSPETTGGAGRAAAPFCRISRAFAGPLAISSGTLTDIAFNATVEETDPSMGAPPTIVIPVSGVYDFLLQVDTGDAGAYTCTLGILNGTAYLGSTKTQMTGSGGNAQAQCAVIGARCAAGDVIKANIIQNSGAPMGLDGTVHRTGTHLTASWRKP